MKVLAAVYFVQISIRKEKVVQIIKIVLRRPIKACGRFFLFKVLNIDNVIKTLIGPLNAFSVLFAGINLKTRLRDAENFQNWNATGF